MKCPLSQSFFHKKKRLLEKAIERERDREKDRRAMERRGRGEGEGRGVEWATIGFKLLFTAAAALMKSAERGLWRC